MAELDMSGTGPVLRESRGPVSTLTNLSGAAVSLALLVGAGVWGYQVMVRDVSGVPVVRALEGPMRIQPKDPGGQLAENEGLAVNRVAGGGTAGAGPEQVTLAPSPVSITAGDRVIALAARTAVSQEPTAPATDIARPTEIVSPTPIEPNAQAAMDALADELIAGAAPLAENPVEVVPVVASVATSADTPPAIDPEAAIAELPKIEGGIPTSLRPVLRPAHLSINAALAEASLDQDPTIETTVDAPLVNPEGSVPVGTRLVQLGAHSSPEIAASEWERLSSRFDGLLGDKTRVIQQATSGGKTFYRLRAMGFDNVSDARRLCSALKAENTDCIPVVAR